MQQRDHHAQRGAARAQRLGARVAAVVALDQPGHRQCHVERVARVVVQRVAAQVAREVAFEQILDVVEGARERCEIGARVACAVHGDHGVADLASVLDVDPVADVVLVEAVMHRKSANLNNYRRCLPTPARAFVTSPHTI
ncbi:MAG: hypothetical protein WDO13_20815 [Verrucomicrobiota bacterium]